MSDANESPGGGSTEIAILVSVQLPGVSDDEAEESLEELEALADTAGARVAWSLLQKRSSYDKATVLGSGKSEEVRRLVTDCAADLVIFDDPLTASQQERLESCLDTRVIDRTALILDIFAQHAQTSEGRAQVELAQHSYRLPRLRGRGRELSRLGGGIGTRMGPGEPKLEVDRRRIRRRMRKLEEDLARMKDVRETQRKQRARMGLQSLCLVGYTNSGKSSILNRLTGASAVVEDRLFSTLDSTTRRLELPGGRKVVLTDTVGFIRKLPHELVAAFRSTLEVVREADILLHVVDASYDERLQEMIEAVTEVLVELEASEKATVLAMNKIDLLEKPRIEALGRCYPDVPLVSARTGSGMDELLSAIESLLPRRTRIRLRVPAARGDLISSLYRDGKVIDTSVEGEDMAFLVELPDEAVTRYSMYRI